MKRVGLFLDMRPQRGGAFQYSLAMLDAVAHLPRSRYQPVVVYTQTEWADRLVQIDIKTVNMPICFSFRVAEHLWRKFGLPISGWRAIAPHLDLSSRRLLAMDFDLWIYPAQDPMAYLLPAPALTTVHDLMHRYEPNFPEVSGYRMREIHYRAICRWVEGVLVDSQVGKAQLVESYGIDPALVYPLPFVAPSYIRIEADPSGFAARYRLPLRFFFYPAQFWPHKNHSALLRAAYLLRETHPDIHFVFIGAKKNGFDRLKKMAGDLNLSDRILILDYIPDEDVAAIYRRARALVMPTFFGPTNIPPLEAMVAGCPMAVSRIYAMPEQCGDAALYFDPHSDKEIADALARLWVNDALCADLAARGRRRAELHSQDTFNQKFTNIVDTLFKCMVRPNLLPSESSRI